MKFEDLLKQHIDTVGGSLAQALRAVSKKHPAAHKAYLDRARAGKAEPLTRIPSLQAKSGEFEARVKELMEKHQKDQGSAMLMAANMFPKEHAEFVARVESTHSKTRGQR